MTLPPPSAAPQAPAATEPNRRGLAALRHRNFALLWYGLIVSNTGTWMQTVAQGWLVLQITNRPFYLGLVALSFALPMTLLPPLGGALADRLDRLTVLRAVQVVQMLLAGLLALLTLTGAVQIWHILLLSFLSAMMLAVDNPTRQAMIPLLVPRQNLMSALSLNSAVFTGAALFGPALAGVLLEYIGPGGLFFLNALSYGAVVLATLLMRGVISRPAPPESGFWSDVTEGVRYIFGSSFLLALILASTLTSVLGRSYAPLLPVFARDVWHVGQQGYGILLSAPGAGALAGAFGLALFGEVRRKGRLLLGAMFVFGVVLLWFAYSPSFLVAVLLLGISGLLYSIFGTTAATLIQLHAPGRLRGRAMSVYTITVIGLPSLGALGTASVAEWLGVRSSVGYSAALLIVVGVGLAIFSRTLRDAG